MVARQSGEPGVNAFRFVLMFTVVMSHAWWLFGGPLHRNNPSYLVLVTAQCSVPAFFIISGYFLRWREGDVLAVTRWALRKLLPLYLLWMAIYAAVTCFSGWGAVYTVLEWRSSGGSVLELLHKIGFGVTTRHLWFLPALALALSATSVSLRLLGERISWCLAVAVAAIGLLTGPYQMFLGLGGHTFRALALTSPLLVLIGIHVASAQIPRRPLLFGLAVLATYCLQVLDDRWLATAPGFTSDVRTAMTLATIPFALSAFLFARSLPPSSFVEWLSARRHYLLVIYCIHPMVLTAIRVVWAEQGLASTLIVTLVAFGLSLLAAALLALADRGWRELRRRSRVMPAMTQPEPVAAIPRG
jgi:surface polysaccharide O-acyltransferase-like enzyme